MSHNTMKNEISRRTFVAASTAAVAGAGLSGASAMAAGNPGEFGKLFVHHVFFWLKKPVSAEARAKFEKALKDLVTVETIVHYHLGVPAPTSREVIDTSYSYSLLTLFKDKKGQDTYQDHPTHLRFVADCKDLWEKVVVYDSVSF
jgi:hypothetical protein